MTTTTIKVDSGVRDRLALLARERGITMGALLAEAAERLEREAFFVAARKQLSRLQQDDPLAWKADRAEAASWQAGTDRDTLSSQDESGWWE
jgi:predicted transcriptional regulator